MRTQEATASGSVDRTLSPVALWPAEVVILIALCVLSVVTAVWLVALLRGRSKARDHAKAAIERVWSQIVDIYAVQMSAEHAELLRQSRGFQEFMTRSSSANYKSKLKDFLE